MTPFVPRCIDESSLWGKHLFSPFILVFGEQRSAIGANGNG
ncbi:hypothetical protein AciX8_3770 [Granulicella mallensis MP5ACTX8]|uniref:Uncharacterized protein n=1 Tax=Granulicella mallensis (strain ATCC BAA-1857 / DSM 23137 / MP5ACTX8) TaxID=682795 RepID=G8P0G6_GRAMM|nr:hypothetical protein AciX8_3770 [Granulicella mallensis MP5ACTX8]